MQLAQLKNKDVTVMGLGSLGGGVNTVKFLAKYGAKLLVTDIKKASDLEESLQQLKGLRNIELVLGHHRNEDFIDKDFIVKNPGVPQNSPYLRVAFEHGVPIETDLSLFFKLSPARSIGVTGTKGKSTTASLIYELLKKNYSVFLAGNIGKTPLDILTKLGANSLVVLELSSWQLQDLEPFGVSPDTSVVTNMYPDHLNRHLNYAEYVQAKKNILRFARKDSIAVLNYDDATVRDFAQDFPGKVYFFSTSRPVNGAFIAKDHLFFGEEGEQIIDSSRITLKGEHNLSNVAAAVTVAKLYKIKPKEITDTLASFSGIPFRQEFVREVNGVFFYNDTTATNPHASIAALRRLGPSVILIAGGVDKNLEYADFARTIVRQARVLVLLPGSASEKLKQALKKTSFTAIKEVQTLAEAVKTAYQLAHEGESIILSPGAASFNLFKNEFDRGEQFNQLVNSL